ncbi:mgat4b, partial [Symbiodinium pilosum]
ASYLEITLSRLFNVLDLEEAATAIIVHLADFDEEWVLKTAGSLNEGFTNEVEEGDLHVIHAPRELYPLKQANLEAFSLSGFKQKELNVKYTRSVDTSAEQASYVSDGKTHLGVVHRRWVLVAKKDLEAAQRGDCKAIARAPEELEVLDESVRGWEENLDGKWAPATGAKVSELVFEKGVLLKFGDSAKRTWWRTKQNLDYTFLMWYASNMSDYYMQLEDDVHPVPHFAAFVRSALERTLMGKPWVMAAFSNLGFIGKVFNNSHLPSLAQFLLTYSAEAPCDWLVWVWIDAWSPTP